jgi:tripartite-type tricarboxylate transporter receptor subunit TctC
MKRIAVFVAGLAVAASSLAQTYPSKPIRVVVPFPPGGVDVLTRVVTNEMSKIMGVPVVLENRAGANGIIGSEAVMRSEPDGYSLLVTTSSTLITSLVLSKNVPFDPEKDFTPVGAMYESTQILAVRKDLPVNSVKELLDYARANPGKVTFASSGIGSAFHFLGESLNQLAGVKMLHVPYKGTGPQAIAIAKGEVDVAFPTVGNMAGNIEKVKVLAVTSAKRDPRMPNVPTVAETAPGFQRIPGWIAMFGPAHLPAAIVNRVNADLNKALNTPEAKQAFDRQFTSVIGGPASDLAATVHRDRALAAALANKIGLKPE